MNREKSAVRAVGLTTFALCFTVPVGAQEPAAPEGGASTSAVLEEVVVTSQRRVENAQNVALAVTAISGTELNDKAVTRVSDLQFASPALSVTDAGLTQSVNIRGIGLASGNPAVANGVATYVDGLFQPPIVTTNAFYDIASVEVLRGPQGTFVGSNSTGGAIFINSRNPTFDAVDGYAEVSGGNHGALGAQGALNVPVGDTFALRFAGNYRRRDSYFRDAGPLKNEPGRLDESSGRIGALWKPTDAFQALLKTEITSRETGGYAYRPIPSTQYAPLRSGDIRDLAYDDPTANDEHSVQSSLELRYETAGGITFRSLSGFQNKRINNLYDLDATIRPPPPAPFPRVTEDQFVREREWTQELNVISPTEGRFDWILGAYYQRNVIDVDIEQPSDGFNTDILINTRKQTLGVFAQGSYELTPALKLDVGLRYSGYKTSQTGGVTVGRGIPVPPFNGSGLLVADLAGSHDDGRPTGKIALDWNLNDNNLLYAFVARGYKPGGFSSANSEFEPETVLDYELGWKVTALDGRLRVQLGAFWNDYTNFQLDVLNINDGRIEPLNLADATIKGVEAQAQAQFGGFGFDVGIAYVDSELARARFVNVRSLPPPGAGNLGPQCAAGVPSSPPVCFDYTNHFANAEGGDNLFSPEVTFNAGMQYAFLLSGDATLTPRINYAYVGSQYTNLLYSDASDLLRSRGLLSAQVSLQRDAWLAEIYGTNLSDKEYVTGQFIGNEFYGPPREYGVRVAYTF